MTLESRGESGALPPFPPVLIHMSMGFMILAVILALVLLLAMGFSFRPALRRLNKTDLVFSPLTPNSTLEVTQDNSVTLICKVTLLLSHSYPRVP